jgi:hypothetical protein
MNRIDIPDNPRVAGMVLDAEHKSRKLEMGTLGNFLGGATEKPGNIAWTAIVGSFVALLLVLFCGPDSSTFPKSEAVTLFGGIITGALGFVFGRTTSS